MDQSTSSTTALSLADREQAEHEAFAAAKIRRGIALAHADATGIDATTARIIAAGLHGGIGTNTERFAATGRLDVQGVLHEITDQQVDGIEEARWYAALWDFLERIELHEPDVSADGAEPITPMVFFQTMDDEAGPLPGGAWFAANTTADELEAHMAALRTSLTECNQRVIVTATVGFHDLELPYGATANEITTLGRHIHQYGEPYACLANYVGFPLTADDFTMRYHDSFQSIEEFLLEQSQLEASATDAGQQESPADSPLLREGAEEYELRLRQQWLILAGAGEAVHIFTREFGLPEPTEEKP